MRVRFNKRIYFCTVATHSPDSVLLLLTNSNGVYTVDLETKEKAEEVYNQLLVEGYCDLSEYEYSN